MAPKNQRDLSGYRYSALSSLVLSAGHRQDQNEPTGEAESLVGRIDPKSMGSRVVKSQVQDVERKRKVAESDDYGMVKKRNWNPGTAQYANVLQASAELDGLRYIPRTDETRSVYELVLTMIQSALGDQTTEVVRSAADTAIEILKDDSVRDLDKKREMETFLGPLPEEKFSQYVNLSKQLTDYEEDTSAHAETSTVIASSGYFLAEDVGLFVVAYLSLWHRESKAMLITSILFSGIIHSHLILTSLHYGNLEGGPGEGGGSWFCNLFFLAHPYSIQFHHL